MTMLMKNRNNNNKPLYDWSWAFSSFPEDFGLGDLFDTKKARNSVNIQNNEHSATYYMDLPGVRKEDIKISSKDRTITVKWKRTIAGSEESSVSFLVRKDLDIENITAELKDGVLLIIIAKTHPEPDERVIELK